MEVRIIVQKAVTKTIPKKKKCKKGKYLPEETLQIAEKRSEKQGKKRKIYLSEYTVPEHSRERSEDLLKWTMQKK